MNKTDIEKQVEKTPSLNTSNLKDITVPAKFSNNGQMYARMFRYMKAKGFKESQVWLMSADKLLTAEGY